MGHVPTEFRSASPFYPEHGALTVACSECGCFGAAGWGSTEVVQELAPDAAQHTTEAEARDAALAALDAQPCVS